jgi:phytol kinase
MLAIVASLAGVFALLVIGEILGRKKILRGDLLRQFVHITVGAFIAFWPWLISFNTIAWLGVFMLAVVLLNRRKKLADFYSEVDRKSFGDIFYALAVVSSALLTDEKVFFAIAMLTMALGDGLANVIGQRYGKNWRYKFWGHVKTVYGSMTMWLVSVSVLGVGLLFVQELIPYSAYVTLLLVVPPLLVLVENAAVWGLDNLLVPIIVLWALNLAR